MTIGETSRISRVLRLAGCTANGIEATTAASDAVSNLSRVELVRVVDGDTIVVDDGGEEQKVRFLGIDAPEVSHGDETGEPCGEEAQEMTEELTAGGRLGRDLSLSAGYRAP